MRCPKCGFITFDDHVACTKCQARFNSEHLAFQGTANQVEPVSFLGSSTSGADFQTTADLSMEAEEAETTLDNSIDLYEELASESLSSHLTGGQAPAEEELNLSILDSDEQDSPRFVEPEAENDLLLDFEDVDPGQAAPPSLNIDQEAVKASPPPAFDLDESDFSDSASQTGRPAAHEEELDLSVLDSDEQDSPAFVEPEAENELLFEFAEENPEEAGTTPLNGGLAAAAGAPPPAVDLNEIDLSDLVDEPEHTAAQDSAVSDNSTAGSFFDLSDIVSSESTILDLDQSLLDHDEETPGGNPEDLLDLDFSDYNDDSAAVMTPAKQATSSGLSMENNSDD
jgi:predicted protein tyrosine phosphatase